MLKVNNWLNKIQYRLFPATCILCGIHTNTDLDLCSACWEDLPKNISACVRCAGQLEEVSIQLEPICGRCLHQPPYFDRSLSPFLYHAPLSQLLIGLKYHQKLSAAKILGNILAEQLITSQIEMPECIVPVPLHRARLRTRGYNQAMELARPVSRRLGIKLDSRLCQRTRNTSPQTGLSATERQKNLRQAFSIKRACEYRHVALLDDVITTGHTVNELAKILRKAGVETIQVWSLARAVEPS